MYDPIKGFPSVVVELSYADPDRAIAWLVDVFGFRLILRQPEIGRLRHADLDTGGGVVMVRQADDVTAEFCTCKQVIVWVSDVDEHFERSVKFCANIIQGPIDKPWGLRQYLVRDIEGHLWEFTHHLRDVKPEDWGAVALT